jgi:hypothetical protein
LKRSPILFSVGLLLTFESGQRTHAQALRFETTRLTSTIESSIRGEVSHKFGLRETKFFADQSFALRDRGYLVSGVGLLAANGRESRVCFAAFVSKDGVNSIQMTVGQGDWEAETCHGVAAVGMVSSKNAASARVGIIYDAMSPNVSAREPVILLLNTLTGELSVDVSGTSKASLAGADTMPKIRKALE